MDRTEDTPKKKIKTNSQILSKVKQTQIKNIHFHTMNTRKIYGKFFYALIYGKKKQKTKDENSEDENGTNDFFYV